MAGEYDVGTSTRKDSSTQSKDCPQCVKLREQMRIHGGDICSLNNEVEHFRTLWQEECDENRKLREQLELINNIRNQNQKVRRMMARPWVTDIQMGWMRERVQAFADKHKLTMSQAVDMLRSSQDIKSVWAMRDMDYFLSMYEAGLVDEPTTE